MSQYRSPAMNNAPTEIPPAVVAAFSYTPTGWAIPPSSSLRTPNRRPASLSYTPTGRVVLSTPTTRGSA